MSQRPSARLDEKLSPWLTNRFHVAVRTGFRRTDENTGRTIEMFLCPRNRGEADPTVADQSYAFFAEIEGDSVECGDCSKRHPVIDFFDAERQGLIVTGDPSSAEDGICSSAVDMAKAIRGGVAAEKDHPLSVEGGDATRDVSAQTIRKVLQPSSTRGRAFLSFAQPPALPV